MNWFTSWLGLSPPDEYRDHALAAQRLDEQRQEMYMLGRQVEVIRRRFGEFEDSEPDESHEGSSADDEHR